MILIDLFFKQKTTRSYYKDNGKSSYIPFFYFGAFIGDEIQLDPVILSDDTSIEEVLTFYMGKNTPDRQRYIIDNLHVEEDLKDVIAGTV